VPIDSRRDVEAFQLILWQADERVRLGRMHQGAL
jgi:hypothetical protein